MADDHAAHAISAYGSTINRTPNLDRIASGGVRLTKHLAAANGAETQADHDPLPRFAHGR